MKLKIALTLFCLANVQVLTYCQNNLPKANNQFALQLWQKTKQDSSNLLISPLSTKVQNS